jgi:signal transduction histidine kinase/ligand-binding sensor domain-containing protein
MMAKRWILVCGTAFLAATAAVRAQKTSNWRVYKSADGLPESYTSSVTVSSRGNVWVKHLNGPLISSLDGYQIKTYPSPGIGANRFYESPGGQLWTIATNGLQLFTDGHWTQYPVPEIAVEFKRNTFNPFRPIPLCPVRQNRVLFFTPDALREFNVETLARPETTVLLPANRTHLQKFSSMALSHDGGLWLTSAHGVIKIAGPLRNLKSPLDWKEFILPDSAPFQNLRDPEDDNGTGVTALADSLDGSGQVLVYFDGVKWSVLADHLKNTARAWRSPNGTCWAISTYSLLEKTKDQPEMTPSEEIPPQRFYDVAVDTNGIFWLATSDGLYRYAPLTWQNPSPAVEPAFPVRAIAEDHKGVIWLASDDAVHGFLNHQWRTYPYPEIAGSELQASRALFAMPGENIILAIGDRLLQFNPSAEHFEPVARAAGGHVKPLGVLKDGRFAVQVISSHPGGPKYSLQLYDGAKFGAFPYEVPALDIGSELNFLFAAPNGDLWLCGNKGIARYHEKKWQLANPRGDALPDSAACMAEVNENHLWCGMQDKVLEFNGRSWHVLVSGLEHVNALLKARDGSVWVATASGVHRFYQQSWAANGVEEGLPANAVVALCQDTEGHLWAGTAHGPSLYRPEADPDPPHTYVRKLPDSRTTFPERAAFTVSFGAEDRWKFTPKNRLLFSYHLDQREWSPFQEESSVFFSDLPSGKHYFQVRSMDRNWNVDLSPAVLDFVITPPWYEESRLLWIGSAGLALALFFAALAVNRHRRLVRSYAEVEAKVALRTRQLERANQELFHSQKMTALGTLAAGIAHDFNNILSIIKGSAQIIEDNLGNPEKITTRTGRIKTVVEQGSGIVNAMLGFSRGSNRQPEPEDINSIVEETITLLGDRFRRDVEVQFVPAPGLPKVPVSRDFIQQILLNLIFNAAEAMTENRRVVLSTGTAPHLPAGLALAPAPAESYVDVSVKDFGCGIAPDIMPRIFEPFFTTKAFSARRGTGLGLSMVYELAKQMQAGLAVESTVNSGSLFTLFIPVPGPTAHSPPEKK